MRSKTFHCLLRSFVILTFLILSAPFHAPAGQDVKDRFVDVKKHIPSITTDIRYYTPHNFVGERIDGYNAPKCLLTIEAANALKKVQEDLKPFSLSLKIYDCYRPQGAVDHFVRWAKDIADVRTKKEFYPTVDKSRLFADGYIARKVRAFPRKHRRPHDHTGPGPRRRDIHGRDRSFSPASFPRHNGSATIRWIWEPASIAFTIAPTRQTGNSSRPAN